MSEVVVATVGRGGRVRLPMAVQKAALIPATGGQVAFFIDRNEVRLYLLSRCVTEPKRGEPSQ